MARFNLSVQHAKKIQFSLISRQFKNLAKILWDKPREDAWKKISKAKYRLEGNFKK
jgi:hypothetical protein